MNPERMVLKRVFHPTRTQMMEKVIHLIGHHQALLLGGGTQPLPRDGGAGELHGDPTFLTPIVEFR